MLEIDRITRRFGPNTAVDAVSLRIPDGQMVGIIAARVPASRRCSA